jgi:hypothetical protein
MTPANPFHPAEAVAPRVKCLVYGQSGVGKTYLALTSPGKVAVIDTEGGTAFYANRAGLSAFDVLPTKTFHDVIAAVAYLKAHPGEYETLVIDPVTVLYETLQDAAQVRRGRQRNDPDAELEMLDWNAIKRTYKALMTDLINLPMHVVVTARERDETIKQGREFVKVGVKPDAEKSTPYYFDTIVKLTMKGAKRTAVIEKDRTGTLPAEVSGASFAKLFDKAIAANAEGTAERQLAYDSDAAETDADTTLSQDTTILPQSDGGLVGIIKTGNGNSDMVLRQSGSGEAWAIGFRLVEGRKKVAVEAFGEVAKAVDAFRPVLIDKRVTAYGSVRIVDGQDAKGAKLSWPVLTLAYMQTPDGRLPADGVTPDEPALPEPPDDVSLVGEAESAPLGLVS